jgi:hypothetical protein
VAIKGNDQRCNPEVCNLTVTDSNRLKRLLEDGCAESDSVKMLVDLGEGAEKQFAGRIVSQIASQLFPREVAWQSAPSNFIPKGRELRSDVSKRREK